MALLETRVDPQWVDYNGHMNDAEYARAFSLAVEALMDRLGLDESGRARHGYTLYTLETHLCYRREAHEGQALHLEVTLLERDAKRLHVFFEMQDDEHNLLATSEQMLMGIDSQAGRPAPSRPRWTKPSRYCPGPSPMPGRSLPADASACPRPSAERHLHRDAARSRPGGNGIPGPRSGPRGYRLSLLQRLPLRPMHRKATPPRAA
ncbi:L-carnitine dehydrogenase [Halomonas elongata]|uniref:L-carnitine dehydrogenase n=1 Tax=Halomonas elongata TaxID=2746 RepID=A0A1B8P1S5_HALEL|nr:L-carnitine dehydrogenase [Halomonas elongata]